MRTTDQKTTTDFQAPTAHQPNEGQTAAGCGEKQKTNEPTTWDAFGNSGMHYPEKADIEGGATDQIGGKKPTLRALKEGARVEYVNETNLGEEYFPAYYNGVLGSIVSLLLGGEPEGAIRLAQHYCDKANKEQ